MVFSRKNPDFAAIQADIERARLQRTVYLATLIAEGLAALGRGFRKAAGRTAAAMEADRKAVDADAFVRRHIASIQ